MEIFVAFVFGAVLSAVVFCNGKIVIEIRTKDITEKPTPITVTDSQLETMLDNAEKLPAKVKSFYEQDSSSIIDAATNVVVGREEDGLYDD